MESQQRNILIAVAVSIVLLCCCCLGAVGLWWLWNNGDALVGTTTLLLPSLLGL